MLERLWGDRDWVESAAFTPDGHGLVSCGWDKTIKYWDVSRLAGSCNGQQSMCAMNLASHEVRVDRTGQVVSYLIVWTRTRLSLLQSRTTADGL